jgi:REP element-mobilizing transposase RayT
MLMSTSHLPQRKRPAHPSPVIKVNQPAIIFLTVCVRDKRPLLANEVAHQLLVNVWESADRWQVGRYVIMPEHMHLFCAPADIECRLRDWVGYWRNLVTRAWPNGADKPLWQRDFWDTQLRREENYNDKWEYVRNNPARANLVSTPDEWPFAGELNVLRW